MMSYAGPEPSVEEIEAEFWRIVETPDDIYESLYGQVCSCALQLVPSTGSNADLRRM